MTEAYRFKEIIRNECIGIKIEEGIDHYNKSFKWIMYYLMDGTCILSCNQNIIEFIPLFDPILEANIIIKLQER